MTTKKEVWANFASRYTRSEDPDDQPKAIALPLPAKERIKMIKKSRWRREQKVKNADALDELQQRVADIRQRSIDLAEATKR